MNELHQVNAEIIVLDTYAGSQIPVHCICSQCNYEWQVRPNNLLKGTGCPVCRKKRAADAQRKTHDQFVRELATIDSTISLTSSYLGAQQYVGCRCQKCNHEWTALATNLLSGKGCPCCAKVVAGQKRKRTHKAFISTLNQANPYIEILGLYQGNEEKIECICHACNYQWFSRPSILLQGRGCPRCGKNERYTQEAFIEKLKSINPYIQVIGQYRKSALPIQCKCLICGHAWDCKPNNLLNRHGCPRCQHSSTSFLEQAIYGFFSHVLGLENVFLRDTKAIGLELDIFIPSLNLAIEPGSWHWHKTKSIRDSEKRHLCQEHGIRLITIFTDYNEDDLPYPDDCLTTSMTLGYTDEIADTIALIEELAKLCGCEHRIDAAIWRQIVDNAYINSRKKTTQQFIEELQDILPYVNILGDYTGALNPIQCQCTRCGHIWESIPHSLLRGHGCRKCANKALGQSQRKTHEQFLEEMNKINPSVEIVGHYHLSSQHIACRCRVCSHSWRALPSNLLKGRGCPVCARTTQAAEKRKSHHKFVEELKCCNGQIEVLGQYIKSSQKIECRCLVCNCIWTSLPNGLLRGRGCPQCASVQRKQTQKETLLKRCGSLQEVNPTLAEQWHPTKNQSKTPLQVLPGSSSKAWWLCPTCGHEWQAVIDSRNRGHGCPVCSRKNR